MEQSNTNTKPTHITCQVCNQSLPTHLFPKKKFANKNNKQKTKSTNDVGSTVDTNDIGSTTTNGTNNIIICCRQCKKNQTAARCKQPTKPQTKQGRKNLDSGVKRRPNNFGYCNYLDQLFSLDCFPDIVNLKAFTSAKDVSESMSALQAATQHGLMKDGSNNNNKKKEIKCLCIGDGSTPRTAVLGCFLKKWNCTSIDPALHEEWHGVEPKGVRGLIGYGGTLEEYLMQMNNDTKNDDKEEVYDHLILLCVHSHARLIGNASISNIMNLYDNVPTTLVSLPCCPKFRSTKDIGRVPDVCYEDDCVFSMCRRVEVWNFDHTTYTSCMECA